MRARHPIPNAFRKTADRFACVVAGIGTEAILDGMLGHPTQEQKAGLEARKAGLVGLLANSEAPPSPSPSEYGGTLPTADIGALRIAFKATEAAEVFRT